MKYLLSILLFISITGYAQMIQRVAPGEYATYNIDATGKLWASGGNANLWGTGATGRQALPNLVKQQSLAAMPNFKAAYAGLDDAVAIDVSGNVWHLGGADLSAAGDGSTEPGTDMAYKYAVKILTDSSGAAFTGITMASQFWQSYTCKGWLAVKGTDSTLWIWGGDDLGNFRGTGVAQPYMSRPRKISIPGNRKVLQVVSGTFVIVRCSDGTVWTWGGGSSCDDYYAALGNGCTGTSYKYPNQVIGLSNIVWVDGGRTRAFAIRNDGIVFGWGNGAWLGIGTTNGTPHTTPTNLSAIWNLPHPATKIVSNVNATHVILTDSTLWAFGSTPQGEVGNGIELDRNAAPYPDWWSWDYSTFTPYVTSPVQINTTRHDFINSYGAMPYTYWFFDECVNGQLYFNGRNKGAIANDGVINSDTTTGSMGSYYDNAWDVITSKPVNPFSLRNPILIPAEPCLYGNYIGCNNYNLAIPPVLPPTINAGTDKTISVFTTTLSAICSPAVGRKISAYVWQQLTGPNTAYFSTFNDSAVTISRLTYGTYTFRITATDILNSSNYDDIVVTVQTGAGVYNDGRQVMIGDYTTHFVDFDGTIIAIGNEGFNGTGAPGSQYGSTGIPKPVLSAPGVPVPKFKTGAGHFHGACWVDIDGHVWTSGATGGGEAGLGHSGLAQLYADYSGYAQRLYIDTAGNPFDSVIQIVAGTLDVQDDVDKNYYLAVKSSGTLWIWGTPGAVRGDGTNPNPLVVITRPTRILMPSGRSVKKIIGGQNKYVIALCTDGTVWTWGGDFNGSTYRANLGYIPTGNEWTSPHQLTQLSNVVDIEGGSEFNFAIKSNGDLWGWGLNGNIMNEPNGGEITFPKKLSNIQDYLPFPIAKLVTNTAIATALLTNGDLYTWGDNSQGSIGNGKTLFGDFFGNDSAGYVYYFTNGLSPLYERIPVHIALTRKFKNVFGGNMLSYYTYALGIDDSLYAWGLNRSSQIANKVEQPISGNINDQSNSWNVPWVTPVHPWSIPYNAPRIISTSPVCINYSGFPCNTNGGSIVERIKPVANAGVNQSITSSTAILNATASYDVTCIGCNSQISYYLWKQVSGPNAAIIDLPASPTPIISGLVPGSYMFRLIVVDNSWNSDTSYVTIIYNTGGNVPPTANAGTSYTIVLPQYNASLYGKGTDIDGTITSYLWTQVSGTAATIANPSNATTNIGGLTSAGDRVFRLTVTDNQGATAYSDITITVKETCD